jgi:uridine kinase
MEQAYLVGITGGSASGKTSFLNSLRAHFNEQELCVVSQDNYYKSIEHQVKDENGVVNYDLPSCIDFDHFTSDIERLQAGQSIHKLEYVFNNPDKKPELIEVKPAPIIVVEGLFIFYHKAICDQLALKIYVDAQEEIKWERRLQRDLTERGIAREIIEYQWSQHVKPAYDQFLLPYRDQADIVVMNNTHFQNSLKVVTDHLALYLINSKK